MGWLLNPRGIKVIGHAGHEACEDTEGMWHGATQEVANPFAGKTVRCRWNRSWGRGKPGLVVQGELLRTFCAPNGHTLIGEVQVDGHVVSCPWSISNYLDVLVKL